MAHFRIRNLYDAKPSLASGSPFIFAAPITSSWRNAPGGLISTPRSTTEFTGHHAMAAVGYDDDSQLLKFMNSWGAGWGERGFGYLPYNYFQTYVWDAWFHHPKLRGRWRPEGKNGPYVRRLMMFGNDLGNPCALVDLWNIADDIRIAWSMMTLRDGYIDIEDFFVRPQFNCSAHEDRLSHEVIGFAADQKLPIRLWVAHADVRSCAANLPRSIISFEQQRYEFARVRILGLRMSGTNV